ncbi:MAG TPA: hypothetical protein VK517_05725 [Cyclobacteriaceae bacterium]|nr:hypothetical protein [Cyclobacteriaceae bacterium]
MKTEVKTEKEFDAVKFVRQQRERIYQEIKDLSPDQQIEYIRKRSEEFQKKLAALQP